MQLSPNHQNIMDRFIKACQTDDYVVAALLVGSYVKGLADEHSDLDLCVITTDDGYKDFIANRSAFVEKLGELLFIEDFDQQNILFLIFADGSEVEISFGHENQMDQALNDPYEVLLDKNSITSGIAFHDREVDLEVQTKKLRRLIYGFWHELSHFTIALARGQLWWAQGQVNALRLYCINLIRLQNDFSDQEIGEEGYFKIEKAIPVEQLSALEGTYCPMEKEAMLASAIVIVRFFRNLAPNLASKHGITYPERLDKVTVEKLEKLKNDIEQ